MNKNNQDQEDHNVPAHNEAGAHANKDHYHDEHHFDKRGFHDDVNIDDFHFKKSIYTSQRNLIYRMTLTGVFLALAVAGTGIDMGLEFVRIPIAGINITFRFFDMLFVLLSIGSVGPIFASIISAVIPWIHLGMHGEHSPYDALIDFAGYLVITWVLWAAYYVLFRNSYVHKEPNRKKDLFKRWTPMVIFVFVSAATYTALIIGLLKLNGSFSGMETVVEHDHDHEHDHEHLSTLQGFIVNVLNHDAHDHEHNTGVFSGNWPFLIFGLFGFETLRFSACYVSFALIEPQVKKLNHRYR